MHQFPLVPEDRRNGNRDAAIYLQRAAFASARHAMFPYSGTSVEQIASSLWRNDEVTPLVLRSAQNPATTTTSGWASQLAGTAVGDFVSSLAPLSAGAKLLDAAVRIDLSGINTISFPSRSGAIDSAAVPWIAEGAAIPVGMFTMTSATLGPTHKLAIITAMTRETAEHASGEVILTQLLRENAALALDASLFSTTAGSASRPAGILNGVTPLGATAGGHDAALTDDLAALAAAIAPVTSGLAFIANPKQASAIKLRRGTTLATDIPIWSTIALSAGTVIALDPLCLVSGLGVEPEITTSAEALLHMETVPLPIATGAQGSGAVATPSQSLFQTDCIAVRLILRATWAWRVSGAVAFLTGATW
jgi:Phage capsid family